MAANLRIGSTHQMLESQGFEVVEEKLTLIPAFRMTGALFTCLFGYQIMFRAKARATR